MDKYVGNNIQHNKLVLSIAVGNHRFATVATSWYIHSRIDLSVLLTPTKLLHCQYGYFTLTSGLTGVSVRLRSMSRMAVIETLSLNVRWDCTWRFHAVSEFCKPRPAERGKCPKTRCFYFFVIIFLLCQYYVNYVNYVHYVNIMSILFIRSTPASLKRLKMFAKCKLSTT